LRVEQPLGRRIGKHPVRLPEIQFQERRVLIASEQIPTVGGHRGVIVDVQHARRRITALGDLVHLAAGGQTRPDVHELPHALLEQIAHDAPEQRPLLSGPGTGSADRPCEMIGEVALPLGIVRTTEPVVVHSGGTGRVDIVLARACLHGKNHSYNAIRPSH
jgi:hypothetical protein